LWAGKIPEANAELSKIIPQVQKAFGAESAETARALDAVSWLNQALGKGDKGEALCRQALAMRRKVLPPTDPDIADSLEHLGELMQDKGLYDESAKAYEQALVIRKNSAGPWSVLVANDLEELAACNQRRGKNDEVTNMLAGALQLKEMREAVFKRYTRQPIDQTVVFRFLPGAANCSRDFTGGNLTERITANGVTVVASITKKPSDFVKTARATIAIQNAGTKPVDILPQPPTMIVLAPKVRVARLMNAEEVAQQIEKKGESKANWIKFWGADATTSVTTTVNSNWSNNYNNRYYIPPQYGYRPNWNWNRNGNWGYGNQTITTQVPDWAARARAIQKASDVSNKSSNDAADTRQTALGPTTVPPGQQLYGTLDFDDTKFTKSLVRIPVGDAVFEFMFDR
jgi:tetratricopeptide (TPR) repeat protein